VSNVAQVDQNETVTAAGSPASASAFSSEQKYVPGSTRPPDDELYGFRTALAEAAEAEEEAAPPPRKTNLRLILLLVLLVAGVATVIIYGSMNYFKPKPQAFFTDLGTQRYDPAGLGGRLIVQWTGSASYKFTVDPVDPALIPVFQATIENPPHAITFSLKMKDASALVACQKDIVIPGVPQGAGAFDQSSAMAARTVPTGDTLQNVAGSDGQIREMVLSGSLPCNLEASKKIVAWEFTTDFPPLSDQKDWQKHEDTVQTEAKKGKSGKSPTPVNYGGYTLVRSLPTPIESDDVIVSDNPQKGIVATSSGRAFLVGTQVLVNPALDWQTFPADIHYRCDRTAMCMVTRLSSRTAVRAHLMK
jgi:hypothetical protein